ncbi:MAG: cytoplasmic protein [Gammaproteobacteria bacterium]|nr:cytoplasmic protein [Gammaproteobacteria bacterium]
MSLSKNVKHTKQLGGFEEFPVKTGVVIFQNAAIGIEAGTGYARPLVAGDAFAGFAEDAIDNSAGADAAVSVRVETAGRRVLTVVGSSIVSNARVAVYASDDGTFTTTAGANSKVGWVSRHITSTDCMVNYSADQS